uniref:C-type lectin domain-containing protein n=1 Tax=Magallana gigas TaxID=29159 RepID=K1RAX5_MAGGI
MDNVPENVTLVNSTINSTVLLRTYNKALTNVLNHGIIKEAYWGAVWQKTYILHADRKTFLEAKNICESNGMNMYRGTDEKVHLHAFEDVWVGLMKHSNSSVWYGAKLSEWVEQTVTLHGQLFHERQYAVLNMSGPSHSANSNLTVLPFVSIGRKWIFSDIVENCN